MNQCFDSMPPFFDYGLLLRVPPRTYLRTQDTQDEEFHRLARMRHKDTSSWLAQFSAFGTSLAPFDLPARAVALPQPSQTKHERHGR